jgi:phenylacetate-CoA ligase
MNRLQLPNGFKNIEWLERELKERSEHDWIKLGERRTLKLFHEMSKRVPAYKAFLKKHKVNTSKIKSISDLSRVPTIDKDNYLRAYPYEDLCWDGEFKSKSWTISTTSGSTGEPYYFPRQSTQDWQYAKSAELYLRSNFDIQNKSTLYIVAFPMGAWIGGLFTYEALKIVEQQGDYRLSIITPGIHKKEIISAVKQLGHKFDQIIIGCYGPFLKDILDDGIREGIKWEDYDLGFVFSAEAFSETFRDYVIKKTGQKDVLRSTLNHYGTVDLGTMSHETPLSILLRRTALEDLDLYKKIFKRNDKLPTFTQYNPALFYFQEEDGGLLCSAYSGIPLLRYDLKDSGGILSLSDAKRIFKEAGHSLDKLAKASNITDTLWNLPFVYVYERNDFSVSYYAFQIYPEMIRRPLQTSGLEDLVTGKFTMMVDYNDDGKQVFEINVELKADIVETEKINNQVMSSIVESLLTESSEFREVHKMYAEESLPHVVLWPYEDETYFKPGVKQKWVKK